MPAPRTKPTASRKPRRRASWPSYEASKAPIAAAGLDPLKYARAVRRLARKMGV
ncbi:hypothetical protein [Zoogloea sp.]|uniref:hypothetical protein n=1 Tax=Zoogloea sp. TaxID=49181 RepID=UPI0035B3FA42